ncbi:protein TIC 40, chloroplastic-like [Phoenix dactylifera]|uniref:Protein TIC 40, chloroplastic-like n=1 Tax=Phoenix dactylifera TaxID=42345 RepID=A0A8B8J9W9_PHODC|nr:protein TIC 40, chloroplastic-like [Phoenix dactylifera]
MESLALASSISPVLIGSPNPVEILRRRWSFGPALPLLASRGNSTSRRRRTTFSVCSLRNGGGDGASSQRILETGKAETQIFASISSSNDSGTSTVCGNPQFQVPSPAPYLSSPLLWIGVGIGLSATLSVVATKFKRRAIQQAFKAVMGQEAPLNGQFNNAAFSPGSPFPFPSASPSAPTPVTSHPVAAENVAATKIEATPQTKDGDKAVVNKEASKHEDAPATKIEATSPAENGDKPIINNEAIKHGDVAATPVASQPAAADNAPAIKVEATPPKKDKVETAVNNKGTKHGDVPPTLLASTPVAAENALLAAEVDATLPIKDRDETVAKDKETKHGDIPPKPVASPQVAAEDDPATNAEAIPPTEDKVETNKQ